MNDELMCYLGVTKITIGSNRTERGFLKQSETAKFEEKKSKVATLLVCYSAFGSFVSGLLWKKL